MSVENLVREAAEAITSADALLPEVPSGHLGLPFGAADGIRRIVHCTESLAQKVKACD